MGRRRRDPEDDAVHFVKIHKRRRKTEGFYSHRRSCHYKTRFRREVDAQSMITAVRRRAEYDGLPLRAYECTVCGGWHVGHFDIEIEIAKYGDIYVKEAQAPHDVPGDSEAPGEDSQGCDQDRVA